MLLTARLFSLTRDLDRVALPRSSGMIESRSRGSVVFIWQSGKQLQRVAGGKRIPFNCGSCKKQTTFYECQVDDTFKAYFVVELWKRTSRAMQCGECLGVYDYYEVFPQEKATAEQAGAEIKRKADEAEAKRKFAAEQDQNLKHEAEQKRREQERRRNELEVEDELAKLKRKLGK
jgi:hypothetical protein